VGNPGDRLTASLLARELEGLGITHVLGIPDNASAALFRRLEAEGRIRVLTVTREGDAFAIAAGLWIGGKEPAVLIQNTGLLESGDSLRGTVMRMRVPLLCLVTWRGQATLRGGDLRPDPETLSRSDVDSVAVLTEPTLRAWGVAYDVLRGGDDLWKVRAAVELARSRSAPAALLIPDSIADDDEGTTA